MKLPGPRYGIAASGTSADAPLRVKIDLRTDALTIIMLLMVTFISSLVVLYASGYMHGDRGYWRFFSYVGLFIFSMIMLVSVSNFLLLFVFWEAVGVCSYLLIGFWYEKNPRQPRRHEGLPGQPRWRLWIRAGDLSDLHHVRHGELS